MATFREIAAPTVNYMFSMFLVYMFWGFFSHLFPILISAQDFGSGCAGLLFTRS